MVEEGPVYGYYFNAASSSVHFVVITGVDVNNDRVYTNNPWGIKGKQTYEEFLAGVAKKPNQSGNNPVFQSIFHVKK